MGEAPVRLRATAALRQTFWHIKDSKRSVKRVGSRIRNGRTPHSGGVAHSYAPLSNITLDDSALDDSADPIAENLDDPLAAYPAETSMEIDGD